MFFTCFFPGNGPPLPGSATDVSPQHSRRRTAQKTVIVRDRQPTRPTMSKLWEWPRARHIGSLSCWSCRPSIYWRFFCSFARWKMPVSCAGHYSKSILESRTNLHFLLAWGTGVQRSNIPWRSASSLKDSPCSWIDLYRSLSHLWTGAKMGTVDQVPGLLQWNQGWDFFSRKKKHGQIHM